MGDDKTMPEKKKTAATRKPRVVILATGGTIAGSAASTTEAGYTSGRVSVDAMLDAVPEMTAIAGVEGQQVANVGSQDMTVAIMIDLARRIGALLDEDAVDGVVVTHGTDTMEETAYFLNLTVKSKKPVVMTGAMRPFTAVSADGPLNLFNAVAVAADNKAADRGVLIVMNDRIHGAHSLTKSNTTSVETFISPISGLIGTVNYGQIEYFRRPSRRHTQASEFSLDGVTALPRVDIIYACIDMPADLIDCSVERGAKGIVIAGDGNGNMNAATVDRAVQAAQKGVVIVRSSRVPTGKVGRNVEIDDDGLGFIASDELNPAKARILLMLALLKKRRQDTLQRLFFRY
jgi:L-asparaginase